MATVHPGACPSGDAVHFCRRPRAASFSFLLAVTVEMVQSNNGLGYRILFAKSIYEPEVLYAALLMVAILGFSVDRLVRIIGRRLLVWQETID